MTQKLNKNILLGALVLSLYESTVSGLTIEEIVIPDEVLEMLG